MNHLSIVLVIAILLTGLFDEYYTNFLEHYIQLLQPGSKDEVNDSKAEQSKDR